MTGILQNAPPLIQGVEPALAHALADELAGLTTVLADLAYDLAANSETLRQHMHSLQAIDRITQAQLAMADVLRSSAPAEERVAAVTLEALGTSLLASLQRYRRQGVPGEFDIA
jgi:hypothetical protein